MDNTYYFYAGKFKVEGRCYHHQKDAIWFEIKANNFNDAKLKAYKYVESIFGEQKECDMWYGHIDKNWDITATTKWFYDRKHL